MAVLRTTGDCFPRALRSAANLPFRTLPLAVTQRGLKHRRHARHSVVRVAASADGGGNDAGPLSMLSQALGTGSGTDDKSDMQVLGQVVTEGGDVIGRLLDSPGDDLGVLVDSTGSVVGELVGASGKEEVGALLAAKSAAMSGWAAQAMALLGEHPVRDSGLPTWEAGLVIGVQVVAVMLAATGGRRLITETVTKAAEDYEARLPDSEADQQTYVYALLKAMEDTSDYLTIGAILLALQRSAVFLQDVFVINDDETSRLLGQTLDVAVLTLLQDSAWLLEKGAGLYTIALVANFLIELKNEVINLTLESKSPTVRLSGVDKSLPVLSSLGNWLIIGASAIRATTTVAGVDASPLVAVGGISGIAVGIGSQQFIQSILAGVSLVGVAESIRLFSTIFRTDGGAPVEVPNRQLVTLVIQNLSRTETTRVLETFRDPRQVQLTIGIEFVLDPSLPLRLTDRIPGVVESVEKYLGRFSGIDLGLPVSCTLKQLDTRQCCTLQVVVHTLPESSMEYDEFVQGLMLGIISVVERSNCLCTKIIPTST